MLEMSDGVSHEEIFGRMAEIPDQGRERRGEIRNHGSFIELEDRLGRFSLLPEGLGEFKAGLVESFPTFCAMPTSVIWSKASGGGGEVGVDHGMDLRSPDARWRVIIPSVLYG